MGNDLDGKRRRAGPRTASLAGCGQSRQATPSDRRGDERQCKREREPFEPCRPCDLPVDVTGHVEDFRVVEMARDEPVESRTIPLVQMPWVPRLLESI